MPRRGGARRGPAPGRSGRSSRRRCTPREGFDAELAGSGEQVEDVGVADMVLNEIKDVFFDPVGGGTGVHAGDGLEPAAPGGTGNNAHNIFLS